MRDHMLHDMETFPGFASHLEADRFLVGENRPEEVTFDGLTSAECETVLAALRARLRHTHVHAWRTYFIGVSLSVAFLSFGLAFMILAPAQILGVARAPLFGKTATIEETALWVILAVLAVIGVAIGDFILRNRWRGAGMLHRESIALRIAIKRGEASARAA